MSKEVLTIDLDWIETPRQEIEIISLCTKLFKQKVDTYFIKAHHHAYDLVPEKATLYNVDHHHDLCYSDQGTLEIQSGVMREGNWILALAMHKKLEAYTWIKNYDSDLQEKHIHNLYRILKKFKIYNSLKDLTVLVLEACCLELESLIVNAGFGLRPVPGARSLDSVESLSLMAWSLLHNLYSLRKFL